MDKNPKLKTEIEDCFEEVCKFNAETSSSQKFLSVTYSPIAKKVLVESKLITKPVFTSLDN